MICYLRIVFLSKYYIYVTDLYKKALARETATNAQSVNVRCTHGDKGDLLCFNLNAVCLSILNVDERFESML